LTSHERSPDETAETPADEGTVPMAVAEVGRTELRLVAEVEKSEVGVEAGLDPALARQAEALGRMSRQQVGELSQLELARQPFCQRRSEERLAARDAAPDRKRVVVRLERCGSRRGGRSR